MKIREIILCYGSLIQYLADFNFEKNRPWWTK